MEGRSEDECPDTHKWNPNILKHHRFKEALRRKLKLPARTLREIDAMKSRAKLRRDAEGQGKSNTLKIGYQTKHSQRQDGNGASILDEMAGDSLSWADAVQIEADMKREMDVDDNPR
jgi:ribosomal protein L28